MKNLKKINALLLTLMMCFTFTSCEGLFDDDEEDEVEEIAGCGSGYQGPNFDIQVDSQCKAAYAYKCSGNQQGVNAACAIYKAWQEDQPGIPNCPYCN